MSGYIRLDDIRPGFIRLFWLGQVMICSARRV